MKFKPLFFKRMRSESLMGGWQCSLQTGDRPSSLALDPVQSPPQPMAMTCGIEPSAACMSLHLTVHPKLSKRHD